MYSIKVKNTGKVAAGYSLFGYVTGFQPNFGNPDGIQIEMLNKYFTYVEFLSEIADGKKQIESISCSKETDLSFVDKNIFGTWWGITWKCNKPAAEQTDEIVFTALTRATPNYELQPGEEVVFDIVVKNKNSYTALGKIKSPISIIVENNSDQKAIVNLNALTEEKSAYTIKSAYPNLTYHELLTFIKFNNVKIGLLRVDCNEFYSYKQENIDKPFFGLEYGVYYEDGKKVTAFEFTKLEQNLTSVIVDKMEFNLADGWGVKFEIRPNQALVIYMFASAVSRK